VDGLIRQALGALGDDFATSTHLLAGQEITYLSPRDGEFNVTVGYCLTDELLLVGFEESLLEHCVQQLKAPGAAGTLAASEVLRTSRKHAAGDLVLESLLNVRAFKQRLGGLSWIDNLDMGRRACTNIDRSVKIDYPTLLSILSSKRVLSSRFRVPNKYVGKVT
jgi:hypothetical protein